MLCKCEEYNTPTKQRSILPIYWFIVVQKSLNKIIRHGTQGIWFGVHLIHCLCKDHYVNCILNKTGFTFIIANSILLFKKSYASCNHTSVLNTFDTAINETNRSFLSHGLLRFRDLEIGRAADMTGRQGIPTPPGHLTQSRVYSLDPCLPISPISNLIRVMRLITV
jgi:hypothetical protein